MKSLRRIRAENVESHVSIKLTQIGLDIDEALCRSHLERILECAAEMRNFVRIDMEELTYAERTIGLFEEMFEAIWRGDRRHRAPVLRPHTAR